MSVRLTILEPTAIGEFHVLENVELTGAGRWSQEKEDELLLEFEREKAEFDEKLSAPDRAAIAEILGE